MGLGLKNIEQLNLKKLLKELDQVNWQTNDYGFFAGSEGARTTSVYLVKDKTVIVNLQMLHNLIGKPVHLNNWALHEAMGALGYDDENYDLSSSIAFLANTKHDIQSSLDYVKNNFAVITKAKDDKVYALRGGSTVVGGGGDAVLIELKQRLLERYLEINPDKAGFEKIIHLKIEFSQEDIAYNNFGFNIEEQALYIGRAAMVIPDVIFQKGYLDKIIIQLEKDL